MGFIPNSSLVSFVPSRLESRIKWSECRFSNLRLHFYVQDLTPPLSTRVVNNDRHFAGASVFLAYSLDDKIIQDQIVGSPLPDEIIQDQIFEPQIDSSALFAFSFFVILYSLLQFRINKIKNASERRSDSLKSLREIKSAQLDSSVDLLKKPTEDEVLAAVSDYKIALTEELKLRTILPGIRIVAPNDPKRREEDVAAAKQFLGFDLRDGEDSDLDNLGEVKQPEREKNRLLLQSRRRFDGKADESNLDSKDVEMSNGAKAVLLFVAFTQILLLIGLSFDPMNANNSFSSLAGTLNFFSSSL